MSGIYGIYNFDSRPADPAVLARMGGRMAHRGPDGAGNWINGPVGLGHLKLHTTPESLNEKQPLLDETGSLCLVLDGRVDNREDIKRSLEAKNVVLRTNSDAELILRSYQAWGEECPVRIIGDFAFAIWDARNLRLFCARDVMGNKPFFYFRDERRFLFSSELGPIFDNPGIPLDPDDLAVADALLIRFADKERTLFSNVRRLAPANSLTMEPSGLRKNAYWTGEGIPELRYRNDKDYAEHFISLFERVLKSHLRSCSPVGIMLSGGIDSSSITGVAQNLIQRGIVHAQLSTWSMVSPKYPSDDKDYIDQVVRMWNIEAHSVPASEPPMSYYEDQVAQYLDLPDYPNAVVSDGLKSLARAKGIRVLLTGVGGDDWFHGTLQHYVDLLRRFAISELLLQLNYDSAKGQHDYFRTLRFAILEVLPASLRDAIRGIRGSRLPLWMSPKMATLARCQEQGMDLKAFANRAQKGVFIRGTSGFGTHALELEERSASGFGLEERHPLCDRRIAEFAITLPEQQRRMRVGKTKYVLRHAMREFVPESVLKRESSPGGSSVIADVLQTESAEAVFRNPIADFEWVDPIQVKAMYGRMRQKLANCEEDYDADILRLWIIFALQLWTAGTLSKSVKIRESRAG